MKIVHVCLAGGWYENNAYQDQLLPRYHHYLGHDVTVIASYYSRWNMETNDYDLDSIHERILDDGVKLLRIKPLLPSKLNAHVHLFQGMRKVLDKERPDLIFLHGVEIPNYLGVIRYKRHHPHTKIVCDNHADNINSHHHWLQVLWSKMIAKHIVIRKLMPVTEWFYGTTPLRCNYLESFYGVPKSKIQLLVMGADDKKIYFDKRSIISSKIRKFHHIKETDFLIVTGGRIDKKKSESFLNLAKAVCDIKESSLKLLIFGPIAEEVKGLFDEFPKDRVICIGQIHSDKVYDYIFAANFVMYTGLHSVLWEQTVASKVPCAFSRINGFEHIDLNGNCILLEKQSVDYYAQIIRKVFNDHSFYEQMKKIASSDASEQFLYSHIANKVINDCS